MLTEWIRQEIELEEWSGCFGLLSFSQKPWPRVLWRNCTKVSNCLIRRSSLRSLSFSQFLNKHFLLATSFFGSKRIAQVRAITASQESLIHLLLLENCEYIYIYISVHSEKRYFAALYATDSAWGNV